MGVDVDAIADVWCGLAGDGVLVTSVRTTSCGRAATGRPTADSVYLAGSDVTASVHCRNSGAS